MEVSYETPASMALAIVFGMIVCSGREENTADGTEEGRHPRLWKTMTVSASVCVILCSLITSDPLLRFELAYEHLTNLQDPRFSPLNVAAAPDEVLRAASVCDRIAPRSPFQCKSLSTYFAMRQEWDLAEKYLEEALRRAPGMAALHYQRYRLLMRDPLRAGEALKSLETARRLSPQNPQYKREMPE